MHGLARCPKLHTLLVSVSDIDDEDCKLFASFQSLETLELLGTSITSSGFKSIAAAPQLKFLACGSEIYDKAGGDAFFSKVMPKVEVH